MILERKGNTFKLTFTTTNTEIKMRRFRRHGPKKYIPYIQESHKSYSVILSKETAQKLFNELVESGSINKDDVSHYGIKHWAVQIVGVLC